MVLAAQTQSVIRGAGILFRAKTPLARAPFGDTLTQGGPLARPLPAPDHLFQRTFAF